VVNPHVSEPREAEIVVRGGAISSGSASTLTHSDIHASNTFAHRDAVMPSHNPLKLGGQFVYTFPPASVSALSLQLR
jgi:alpha-L-arabinofuranosidase